MAEGHADFKFAAGSKETSHHLKGLRPHTTYHIRIAAETACGHPGYWGETLSITTPQLPPLSPTGVVVDTLPGSFRKGKPTCMLAVTWNGTPAATADPSAHARPAFFEAEAMEEATRAIRGRHTTSKEARAATLHGLQPGIVYSVRVRAVAAGAIGVSNWSVAVRVEAPQLSQLMPLISLASSPRTVSSDLCAADSRCALEVQSQSSEGCEGGTPRSSGIAATSVASVAPATPQRKQTPPTVAAPAARKRAVAPTRQRAAGTISAPTARGPPRRRGRITMHLRRQLPLFAVLVTLCTVGLLALTVMRST